MADQHHPARYTPVILDAMDDVMPTRGWFLDPYGGTGRIHQLRDRHPGRNTVAVEIEPEWAAMHPRTICADSSRLPFRRRKRFDMIATSPDYGNRMADGYDGRDGSKRTTYRLSLGRPLTAGNGAAYQFGPGYQALHTRVMTECVRYLRHRKTDALERTPRMLLNMSNHIRAGVEVDVVGWWLEMLAELGLTELDRVHIPTPRMRHGANSTLRVEHEVLVILGWSA